MFNYQNNSLKILLVQKLAQDSSTNVLQIASENSLS